jgi:streptomycin 6-kinase
MSEAVDDYLCRWRALPDGVAFSTATSILAPARRDGAPLMLKIATELEEQRGNRLMTWWNGRGAARVLEHDDRAVLLERATGTRSLADLADAGGASDDAATGILCRVGTSLHAIDDEPPDGMIDLTTWFRDLFGYADEDDGFFARSAKIASALLQNQQEVAVLHGDLHHGNVLDFGADRHPDSDGWLAIDPKYLVGDRAFDFTNIVCNPSEIAATTPGRLARQLEVISATTGIDRTRLLRWTIAWCGLSAAWAARDGYDHHAIAVGEEAERLLSES